MKKSAKQIVCLGEILWDALPDGLFLGGAPLNVCLNLHELDAETMMVSRVGKDRLGTEAVNRIKRAGVDTTFIQSDAQHETGFVEVSLTAEGDPEYEILQPVAWDFIDINQTKISKRLDDAWAVVFGTLAMRKNSKLKSVLDSKSCKVLDMNLRAPHYEKDFVLQLIAGSDIIKMNRDELMLLQNWCSLSSDREKAMHEIADKFDCHSVCVTRGGEGALLLHRGKFFQHPGYSIHVTDAVGAGDAFLAALLFGLKTGCGDEELLSFANAAGAFVASKSGANPAYSVADIESLMQELTSAE